MYRASGAVGSRCEIRAWPQFPEEATESMLGLTRAAGNFGGALGEWGCEWLLWFARCRQRVR